MRPLYTRSLGLSRKKNKGRRFFWLDLDSELLILENREENMMSLDDLKDALEHILRTGDQEAAREAALAALKVMEGHFCRRNQYADFLGITPRTLALWQRALKNGGRFHRRNLLNILGALILCPRSESWPRSAEPQK